MRHDLLPPARRTCWASRELPALEKGKIADVVAIPGDPIVDITATERLSFVMKDGRIVKNDNL